MTTIWNVEFIYKHLSNLASFFKSKTALWHSPRLRAKLPCTASKFDSRS
jgi:hypothetical protein